MNIVADKILTKLRALILTQRRHSNAPTKKANEVLPNSISASNIIVESIEAQQPLMICRFGATEMGCIVTYLNTQLPVTKYWKYLKGQIGKAWWDNQRMVSMNYASGFFPSTPANLVKFSKLMIEDMKQVDILGSWLEDESRFENNLTHSLKIYLRDIVPFFQDRPWTEMLTGKKVLVIHPFEDSIIAQYKKRELLFADKRILPKFQLKTIRAIQGYTNTDTGFTSWFEALEFMKKQINETDFDIALIGCGAYGFPLAAHIKRIGKQAVHMGGAVQLLFGIRGRRWDDLPNYQKLINEHWVRPLPHETPPNHKQVESGPYW